MKGICAISTLCTVAKGKAISYLFCAQLSLRAHICKITKVIIIHPNTKPLIRRDIYIARSSSFSNVMYVQFAEILVFQINACRTSAPAARTS